MKEQYPKLRDDLLFAHPWNFATKRETLAASVTPPLYDFGYQFPLPADCLRVVDTDLPKDVAWKVEGRNILANSDAITIKYITQITDVTLYPPSFVEVLSCKLAAEVAYSLTQNASLKNALYNEYMLKLKEARSFDAQEANGDKYTASSWLNARA